MIETSATYDAALEQTQIFPMWKILSFNPATDDWAQIIDGTYVQTPVDLSDYVDRIEYSFDRVSVTLSDNPSLVFHPDGGALRAALKQGRIIRVQEGFEGVPESDWIWTFSGTIEGTYTWAYQRGENIMAQFSAFSRSNNQAWKRRAVTSNSYTIGSDWSQMFMNIVKDVMLMADAEVVVPEPWNVLFDKNSNQIVNMPPWDAMEQLMFGIQAKPWFNGKGQLAMYSTTQNRSTLSLSNDNYLRRYESKGSSSETINKVILTYLSNTLSRVNGPDQALGSAVITGGFFRSKISVDVYYSDARKSRSDNPRFIVKQSANTGFLPVCTERMDLVDAFHSTIVLERAGWVPWILLILLAAYLLAAAVGFFGASEQAQAVILIVILLIIMSIGTGVYEVWGIPYEMVYLEQQAIALKSGLEFWQEREKEIRNDFISTLEQAQPLVVNELNFEVMKENPRTLLLRYDPRIEPGDVIQLSSTMRVWVEAVSRTLVRGSSDMSVMTVSGFRTVL